MPDWVDVEKKVILETKGRLTQPDRAKLLLVKHYFPDWKIIMVFDRSNKKLSTSSKVTYADWCNKNGIYHLNIKDIYNNPQCLLDMIQT